MKNKKKILVVAPHPDDETLGVGGTIAKFAKNGDDVLNTRNPEFIDWKWIEPEKLPEVIVNFKKDLYKNILKEINLIID